MSGKLWLAVGAVTVAAAGAYAARWRANYKRLVRVDVQPVEEPTEPPGPPEDIAGAVELTEAEQAAWDHLQQVTCMGPCCVDQDAIEELMAEVEDEEGQAT